MMELTDLDNECKNVFGSNYILFSHRTNHIELTDLDNECNNFLVIVQQTKIVFLLNYANLLTGVVH